ncbi:hypothetical protein H9P43_003662 [Blastocladiella emersonii ATCC 22665]|nr:hypothetical protein H9P43_003662 [Blastocladiella emersonii ATCC 22665]
MLNTLGKSLAGLTAAGALSLGYISQRTPQIGVPTPSLLASEPTAKAHADAFALSTSLPHGVSIDAFASAFERSPIFRLEQRILQSAGRAPHGVPTPASAGAARFRSGQRMGALWTVAGKDEPAREILFAWHDAKTGVRGSTWLRIAAGEPKPATTPTPAVSTNAHLNNVKDVARAATAALAPDSVVLQFGSSIDVSPVLPGAQMPSYAVVAHALYSRVLLMNAALQLWWDLRKTVQPGPAVAKAAVSSIAGAAGIPLPPQITGGAPAGPTPTANAPSSSPSPSPSPSSH